MISLSKIFLFEIKKKKQIKISELVRLSWVDYKKNLFLKNNELLWLHGTNKVQKIIESGYLLPFDADTELSHPAIWMSNNIEEANDYGKYIIGIKKSVVNSYKNEKYLPGKEILKVADLIKDIKEPLIWIGGAVVFAKIPISKLYLVKSKSDIIPLKNVNIKNIKDYKYHG